MKGLIIWALTVAACVAIAAKAGTEAQKQVTSLFNEIEQAFPE